MLSSAVLSTSFAILISWALFALFCSFVHEAIAQTKAERGRFMRKYLFKQLQDLPNGVNWASMLYLHGTIDLMSREANEPTSYIPADVFAKTLVEVVGNAQIVQLQLPALHQHFLSPQSRNATQPQAFINTTQNYFSHAALYNFKAATQLLQSSAVVAMLIQAMNNAELQANAGSAEQWVTEARIYEYLVLFIEKWYTDFTQRLSYWYKKKTRQRLFLLGCLLALLFNIDSIQLFSFYTGNAAARNAVINEYRQNAGTLSQLAKHVQHTGGTNTDSAIHAAESFIPSETTATMDSVLTHLRSQNMLQPSRLVLDNAAAKQLADSVADSKYAMKTDTSRVKTPNDSLINILAYNPTADTLQFLSKAFLLQADSLQESANLPVGFQYSVFKQQAHWFYPIILKLLGILISGLAASFGGPFWFDVLRKIYTRK